MYKVGFERTLFGNLYNEYKRKDLPDNVTDFVALKKADKAFDEILGGDLAWWVLHILFQVLCF